MDWDLQHKKICKRYNQYTVSREYQALAAHEKMDALMLSHISAQLSVQSDSELCRIMLELLPGPSATTIPPIAFKGASVSLDTLSKIYARFGNNNFAVHSHFSTVGHGVFPLASRLFNHSCVPNAAARYTMIAGKPVQMDVVALREIEVDEEVRKSWH